MSTIENTSASRPGSSLQETSPELYGKLLEIDASINDVGGLSLFFHVLVLLGCYCALAFGWFRMIPWLANTDINTVWMYLIVFVILFGIWAVHVSWLERLGFRRQRVEFEQILGRSGMTRYQMLSAIEGDTAVAKAAKTIKLYYGRRSYRKAH